jgi:hypothetical protein
LQSSIKALFVATGLMGMTHAALAQDFLAYEGKNAIHEGQGGEKKSVDGIDFWMNGDPPRRYELLGSLTDERHKSGLWGMISMSNLDGDIAKAAKAAGGDAVILAGEQDEVTGVVHSVNGTAGNGSFGATGFSRNIKQHDSRYLVVKYLPDDAPAAPSAQPSPPAQ